MLNSLKLEQGNTETLNIRLNTGAVESRRKKVYVDMDNRITEILSSYSVDKLADLFENLTKIIEF